MADTKENEVSISDSPRKTQTKMYTIGGIGIHFPCQAYPSQMAIMDKIVRGLQRTQNCLLESPTGSGKTLALLCGVLAWQRHEREKRNNEINQLEEATTSEQKPAEKKDASKKRPRSSDATDINKTPVKDESASKKNEGSPSVVQKSWQGIDSDDDDDLVFKPRKKAESIIKKLKLSGVQDDSQQGLEEMGASNTQQGLEEMETSNEAAIDNLLGETELLDIDNIIHHRVPKIFFGTRTHKQIAQVVKELSRTEYKTTRMCILSGREHTCIQTSKSISSKNELCHSLLDPHNGPGCIFNNNVSRMGSHSALARLGFSEVHDIEDLIKLGKTIKSCPYFASRSLMMTADIVFCPYNYLIDPVVRNSLNINLNGAIVVFDEAHNVEDMSRSSGSGTFSSSDIFDAVKDCMTMVKKQYIPDEHQFLADFLNRLADWINTSFSPQEDQTETLYSGIELLGNFKTINIGPELFEKLKTSFQTIMSDMREKEMDSNKPPKITINALTRVLIDQLILVLGYLYKDDFCQSYHGQLYRELKKSGRPGTPRGGWMSARDQEPELKWNNVLKISCLDPSVVFRELTITRSIILSSGTLSPMDTFESELGVQFPHKLEASHVIHSSQVFVSTVFRGPMNISLDGKYSNAMTFGFQEEIGRLVIEVCKTVPHGVLCFLPSYTLMDKLIYRWTNVGIMNELEKYKFVFFEPRNNNEMNTMMVDFYEKIKATENGINAEDNNCITGCLLFGICRGKISEGIDFTDNDARAVITIGIPYPNIKDMQVKKKMEYNNKHVQSKRLLSGDKWYQTQAFRALNQALGRCIRHRNDWGAIILVDQRFERQSNTQGLSKWVRQQVKPYNSFNYFVSALQSFVGNRKEAEMLKKS